MCSSGRRPVRGNYPSVLVLVHAHRLPVEHCSAVHAGLIHLNPMAALMSAYQGIFVLNQWPDWESLLPLLVVSLVTVLAGLRLFQTVS